jgi:hypothetical protein
MVLGGLASVTCTPPGPDEEPATLGEASAPLAAAHSLELVATQDVVVNEADPATSYNSSLMCSEYSSGLRKWTYLKFNTAGLVAPFSRALLRVWLSPNGNTSHNFRIYTSTNTSWTETLTWNTKPAPGTTYVTVPSGSVGSSFFDIDVSSLINTASSTQTLIVQPVASTDTDALCFYDRLSEGITAGEVQKVRLVFDYYASIPAADAHVDAATPAGNFGNATTLPLVGSAPERRAYLKFPVSRAMMNDLRGLQLHGASISNTVPSPRGRVMLRLHPTVSTAGKSAVVHGPNAGTNWTDWTESGLTWDNQPAGADLSGATAIATISNTVAARWIDVDVTQAVANAIAWADTLTTTPQSLSINLLLAGGAGTFASKEDPTNKPRLVFLSSELPVKKADGVCAAGEDCATSATDCGACGTSAYKGGYVPVWGDLHRHALSHSEYATLTASEVQTHTRNVLAYLRDTEKMDFVSLSEHEWISPIKQLPGGFDAQLSAASDTLLTGRYVPAVGIETNLEKMAKEIHMKFDVSGKAGATYSAVKLRVKVVNTSSGQLKMQRRIRCVGGSTLGSAWWTLASPTWDDRWARIWDEQKTLFSPASAAAETWYDIDVSELLLKDGMLYQTMSGSCGTPDPDDLRNVVLSMVLGNVFTDAFGIYSRDDGTGGNAPRLVFFVNGVEQPGPVLTNADQRFMPGATWSPTEPTFAVEILDGDAYPMGHTNVIFPPQNMNLRTYTWTSGVETRNWFQNKQTNREFYDYLDDTANGWYGQINHPHNSGDSMVDPTLVPSAVARLATYEFTGGAPAKWGNTAYYSHAWQEKVGWYLHFLRRGWRVSPAANTDSHCANFSDPPNYLAHNCPSTMSGPRTGLWVRSRSYGSMQEAFAQKRSFAHQGGPFEDKQTYIAMHATQSSTFDANWWMGSVLPNRSPWTLTVFARNFNSAGLGIKTITVHHDDGYGALTTIDCESRTSCGGSFSYTPSAANKAVMAVVELSDGRWVLSAPFFF